MSVATLLIVAAAAAHSCDVQAPIRTSVAQISDFPDLYVGRCVTVTAYSDGLSLFTSRRAMEQRLRAKRWRLSDESRMQHVGIYFPEQPDAVRELESRGVEWTVSGRVETCERMIERGERAIAAEPPDESVLRFVHLSGHCHYWHGPVILARTAQPQPSVSR